MVLLQAGTQTRRQTAAIGLVAAHLGTWRPASPWHLPGWLWADAGRDSRVSGDAPSGPQREGRPEQSGLAPGHIPGHGHSQRAGGRKTRPAGCAGEKETCRCCWTPWPRPTRRPDGSRRRSRRPERPRRRPSSGATKRAHGHIPERLKLYRAGKPYRETGKIDHEIHGKCKEKRGKENAGKENRRKERLLLSHFPCPHLPFLALDFAVVLLPVASRLPIDWNLVRLVYGPCSAWRVCDGC